MDSIKLWSVIGVNPTLPGPITNGCQQASQGGQRIECDRATPQLPSQGAATDLDHPNDGSLKARPFLSSCHSSVRLKNRSRFAVCTNSAGAALRKLVARELSSLAS